MSNIIVSCFFVLILCMIGTIFAFPTKERNTNRALSDLQAAKQCNGNKYNLNVPSGIKLFWSGFGVTDSDKAAAEIAQYISKKSGEKCWTLESILELPENRHIKTCEWTPTDTVCQQFWHDISCEYATKARGSIRFVLGPNVRETSSWVSIESGQIKHNQQSGQYVYGFEKYDLHTIYCQEMKNHPTQYPDVKNNICA